MRLICNLQSSSSVYWSLNHIISCGKIILVYTACFDCHHLPLGMRNEIRAHRNLKVTVLLFGRLSSAKILSFISYAAFTLHVYWWNKDKLDTCVVLTNVSFWLAMHIWLLTRIIHSIDIRTCAHVWSHYITLIVPRQPLLYITKQSTTKRPFRRVGSVARFEDWPACAVLKKNYYPAIRVSRVVVPDSAFVVKIGSKQAQQWVYC